MSLAPRDPRLHDDGRRRFTDAVRRQMIAAYVANEEPLSAIASRFGCSPSYPVMLARQAGIPLQGRRGVNCVR